MSTIPPVHGRRLHRTTLSRGILAAALVAAALAVAGCTEGGGEGTGTTAATSAGSTSAGTAPSETSAGGETQPAETQEPQAVLRVNFGEGPKTLDPAAATDTAAGNVLLALLDPLVRLDDEAGVVPALATRWDVEDGGRRIVFHLRQDGVWTNGDPVTAADFEYAWKRAMAPRFASANAPLFADIVGAERYTRCDAKTQDCAGLRDRVGVEALDDVTLEVRLKRPQPWFAQRVAHWAFLPVHEPTIEQYKRRWTDPANIVSNGPFTLADWVRKASITLERWDDWRDAGKVQLTRVEGSLIADPQAALTAFENGDLDACLEGTCVPEGEAARLAETPEFAAFPAPATAYLDVDVERVPAPGQRRAIALALNRRAIVVDAAPGVETPATSLTPFGLPGFSEIDQAYLTDDARRARARRLLRRSDGVKSELTLGYPQDARELADLIQLQLGKVGLDVRPVEQDPRSPKPVDLELASATAPDADAIDVLGRFVCGADGNGSGFCDETYDRLVKKARSTVDEADRYAIYGELEAMLTGKKGEFPAIPVYWDALEVLRRTTVQGFEPNLYGLVDFTGVTVPAS